jgi:hypothetical protein
MEVVPTVAEEEATEGEHGLGAVAAPAHPGLFHAGLDDSFAGGLNGATADGVAGLAEGGIVHAAAIMQDVADCLTNGFGQRCALGVEQARSAHDLAQAAVGEGGFLGLDPAGSLLLRGEVSIGGIGNRPEPLYGMPPVQNLDAHGKTHEDDGPGYPLGPRRRRH